MIDQIKTASYSYNRQAVDWQFVVERDLNLIRKSLHAANIRMKNIDRPDAVKGVQMGDLQEMYNALSSVLDYIASAHRAMAQIKGVPTQLRK